MAARAWGSREQKATDEIFFSNDAVSLCLLVHRRAKTMRVIDFRAGPSDRKRQLVLKLAQREGVEKVYTLVERDEVGTWTKLGFTKEGNIPGFYKRSDAFLLGCPADAPIQSETRISIGWVKLYSMPGSGSSTLRTASINAALSGRFHSSRGFSSK